METSWRIIIVTREKAYEWSNLAAIQPKNLSQPWNPRRKSNLNMHESVSGPNQHTFRAKAFSKPTEAPASRRKNGRLSRNLINFKWIFYFNFCDFESFDGARAEREDENKRDETLKISASRGVSPVSKLLTAHPPRNFTKTRFLFRRSFCTMDGKAANIDSDNHPKFAV